MNINGLITEHAQRILAQIVVPGPASSPPRWRAQTWCSLTLAPCALVVASRTTRFVIRETGCCSLPPRDHPGREAPTLQVRCARR